VFVTLKHIPRKKK